MKFYTHTTVAFLGKDREKVERYLSESLSCGLKVYVEGYSIEEKKAGSTCS